MTDYQRFLRENLAISQGLVGTFNDDDKYVVSQDAIQEIVSAKKMLTSYKENEASCELCTPNNTFKLKFRFTVDIPNNKKFASLYLLETFDLYGDKQELDTFLINYNEVNDNTFLEKFKKAFNLTTKDESQGKDIKTTALKFETLLMDKKAKLKAMSVPLMAQNKKYIQDILKILKASGASGDEILKIFKKEISKMSVDKLDPMYWQKVKDILDKILYKNVDKLSVEYKKQIEEVNQQFIKMFRDKFKGISLVVAKKDEAKKKPIIKPNQGKQDDKKKKNDDKKNSSSYNFESLWKFENENSHLDSQSGNAGGKYSPFSQLNQNNKVLINKEIMFGMRMGKYVGLMRFINVEQKDDVKEDIKTEQPKQQMPQQQFNNQQNKDQGMELSR